jgi:shikimate 5-dehydrogenase
MGEAGIATRALSPYLGARLSFGAFDAAGATAPGQLPVAELVEVYGVGRRRGVSALCVLLGGVVSHSLSPALHNGNFEATAPSLLYVPFALRSLEEELPGLSGRLAGLGLPLVGASVTIPFKEQAARWAGGTLAAANTLLPLDGGWRAENTDRDAFDALVPPAPPGARALVLGAGGTARTAAESLAALGYRVAVSSRREAPARAVAEASGGEVLPPGALEAEPRAGLWAVLVNATPLGLGPNDPLPCPASLVTSSLLVVDAPYRAGGTALSRLAASRGGRILDGFALLVAQAARQASLFTSRPTSARSLLASLSASRRALFELKVNP